MLLEAWEDLAFHGSSEIDINYESKTFKTAFQLKLKKVILLQLMVQQEELLLGEVPTVKPEISGDFSKLMSWADGFRKLNVRTNSETPLDTKTARDFGAEGIGLCQNRAYVF